MQAIFPCIFSKYFQKVSFLLILAASITLNSCISNIVTGFKNTTKFTIATNVNQPKVVVLDRDNKGLPNKLQPIGKTGIINLSKANFSFLEISKPGFQNRNVDIFPTHRGSINKLIDFGGGAIIGYAGLNSYVKSTGSLLKPAVKSSDYISLAVFIYGVINSYGALVTPAPGIRGAYARFKNPNLNIDLFPDTAINPGKLDIVCDEVKASFKKNVVLGNRFYYQVKMSDIKMKDTSTYRYTIEAAVNNQLTKIKLLRSYKAVQKSRSIFDKSIDPQYIIKAKVVSATVNAHTKTPYSVTSDYSASDIITSSIKIEWKIYDKLERLLFTKTTEGWGQRSAYENEYLNEFSNNGMQDAVSDALNKLAFSEEFTKYIKTYKEVKNTNEKFTTTLLLDKPKPFGKDVKFINEASKSVVTIIRKDSHGSGTIISSQGYILTNAHVCGNDSVLKIRFKNGDETTAKLVRMNLDEDLALLKFDNKDKINGILMSTDNKGVQFADEVYTIGTPADLSLNQSISKGLISGIRVIKDKKLFQTDAAINGGNSGGAMLDSEGVLIGIPSSKISGTGLEGLGFAIPSSVAMEFLKLGYK